MVTILSRTRPAVDLANVLAYPRQLAHAQFLAQPALGV
jgi:hypothetical protein